ncbi:hydroxymethylbilane synthase [Thermosulfuriphilus ammonigenes]|uniref:Porphobilinogen deaminase n=1 Tax=Thermosulfuriphilus ammonigenes TaxID=1936021 RepID=A0A6G7PWB8_9BACT|nr:hydroxymethylbilane synthase [Thermosulfuriphilus ammonigenes]MBA2847895.1 hydroxymethylbilane synthase [Thermosulfuriphilus ammonigenes]QIJ71910.1 hydroxymethylbilane synthase [Thermosulfuriphilus ammonigenes]
MSLKRVIIGTRGSKLALTQTEWVREALKTRYPGLSVELEIIKTKGDKILDVPLAKVGGKGLFVKEIEEALLCRRVDLAVHSLKDVPTELPEGLEIAIVPRREDPRDVLISRSGQGLKDLPPGGRLGTSSLRRQAQIRALRPDLVIEPLRGNVDTRLRKLDEGRYEAIVLAAAGLRRLGQIHRATEFISPETIIPAIGQGALGIEVRADDKAIKELLSFLHHPETAVCTQAERAFLARLEGGCQVPLAAHATLKDGEIHLAALVADPEGRRVIRRHRSGPASEAAKIGVAVAEEILEAGGRQILEEVYKIAEV